MLAHRGIQANVPGHAAPGTPLSVRVRVWSSYQRHCLWDIEQTFRTAKHLLATRPIFHKLDETIRGHVFCSFLALVLKAELETRIAALGQKGSWPTIIGDLDALTETEVEQDGRRFTLRSAPGSAASLALRAVGIALPPSVQSIASD